MVLCTAHMSEGEVVIKSTVEIDVIQKDCVGSWTVSTCCPYGICACMGMPYCCCGMPYCCIGCCMPIPPPGRER